jgi:hypothetical protein
VSLLELFLLPTNPTVMVIQQWSKQCFHPHHPGGVSTTPLGCFSLQIYWENAKYTQDLVVPLLKCWRKHFLELETSGTQLDRVDQHNHR